MVNGFLLLIAGALSYKLAEWTLAPLKRTFERERRFLSDASHELRTPLSILKMDMENELMNSRLSESNQKKIASNLEEVNRMSGLVGDLLTISRLSEHENIKSASLSKVNLSEMIRKTVQRLATMALESNVTIDAELPADDIVVHSDHVLVEAILLNCIKNAITYNKPEGSVSISLSDKKDEAIIVIKDTGIGLSAEDAEKIFDRFYRVDISRSRRTGGSGLGLSIVKSAIDKLGGQISLKSELNVGTTITIRLSL